jgi:hypothetical protein
MKFAKRVFTVAGIYGLVVLVPMYFLAGTLGEQDPPAITHLEYFYGFLGVAVAWQVLFLLIAREPLRLRPAILPAVLEKLGYGVAVWILLALGKVTAGPVITGSIDLVFAVLFATAYVKLGREHQS